MSDECFVSLPAAALLLTFLSQVGLRNLFGLYVLQVSFSQTYVKGLVQPILKFQSFATHYFVSGGSGHIF